MCAAAFAAGLAVFGASAATFVAHRTFARADTVDTTSASLTLTGAAAPDPVGVGSELQYTFTAGNSGTSPAANVALADPLPAGTVFVAGNSDERCNLTESTVTCDLGTIEGGTTTIVTIAVTAPSEPTTLSNTAAVADDASHTATATVDSSVLRLHDVGLQLAAAPDPVGTSSNLTYTLTATNVGAAPADNVVVTDQLPAGVSFVSAGAEGCTQEGATVTCPLGTIGPGDHTTFSIVVTAPAQRGSLHDTATVAATSDDDPANDSASVTTAVQRAHDVSAGISAAPNPVGTGSTLTYTLTAKNEGTAPATNVRITDPILGGTGFVAEGTDLRCSPVLEIVTCSLGEASLASGAHVDFTVVVATPGTPRTITNTATVHAAGDENPENDSATVQTAVNWSHDLSVGIVATPNPVGTRAGLTYTLSATNAGTDPASDVTITDPLPAGVTFVPTASDQRCAAEVALVTCATGALAVGAHVDFAIVVTAPDAPGTLSNTATVHSAVDENPLNDSATVATAVHSAVDVGLALSAAPDPANTGAQLTYTLTATNLGTANATGVTITDQLPDGIAFVSGSSDERCSLVQGTVTCNIGGIPSGAHAVLALVVTPAAAGRYSNTAVVHATGDEVPGNDSASVTITARSSGAVAFLDSCTSNVLGRNDDGSTGRIQLPFALNFFGRGFDKLFVNNNGNVTFNTSLGDFTPDPLVDNGTPIIAPFWADVDTRGSRSGVVHYGATTYNGRPAFCILWSDVGFGKGVGYYAGHTDKLNSFQLLLVDRSDIGTSTVPRGSSGQGSGGDTMPASDFDMIFNYDNVQWETGDASDGSHGLGGFSARIGYSNGDTASFELPGSAVNGAFLDSNPNGLIHGSRGSAQAGRYIFPVRSGNAPVGGSVSGHVADESGPLGGTFVSICGNGACATTVTNDSGAYSVTGLLNGDYVVRVLPTADTGLLPGERTITVESSNLTGIDFTLRLKLKARVLSISGCQGGTAQYTITRNGVTIATGPMAEATPGGIYTIDVDAVSPVQGHVQVGTSLTCPNSESGPSSESADVFADPSGSVVDGSGRLVSGATVTLLRRNENTGSFDAVPPNSSFLSAASPDNPQVTGDDGSFGWDVAPGEYQVRAHQDGCGDAATPTLTVTAAQNPTGLVLTLPCGVAAGSPSPPVVPPPFFPPIVPPATPPLPPPVPGVSADLVPAIGTVTVNGVQVPAGTEIKFGDTVDTTNGVAQLTTAGPDGKPQTMSFFGGPFQLRQGTDGVTELVLSGNDDFAICTTSKRKSQAVPTKPKPKSKTVVRSLWGEGKGSFRTRGRFSAATVRGTMWFTADRCDGTYTQVNQGIVNVLDLVRNRTLIVQAGHSVLVRPRP